MRSQLRSRSNSTRLAATLAILVVTAAGCGSGEPPPTDAAPQTWDYVVLGSSYSGQASWPEQYAGHIEEDLGVEVVVHDRTVNRGRADAAAERIRTDEALRELIGQAEVLTIGLAFDELGEPLRGAARGECDAECVRDVAPGILSDWEAVLDEVLELRDPTEANIVAIVPGAWIIDYACGERVSPCWEIGVNQLLDMYDSYADAARARGMKVADTLTLLHPDVLEAPVDPAYLQPDGLHLSDEASVLIAELLRELGYD